MATVKNDRTTVTVRELEYDNAGRVVKETTTVTTDLLETQTEGEN